MQLPVKLEFTERPDHSKLKEQVHNSLIYPTDRVRLYKYLQAVRNGAVKVEYQRKKFNGTTYGRYFPTSGGLLSATYQWRKIRATLFAESCNDIDIQNCHPVLLEQLYKKTTGKDAPQLSHYIANREKIIAESIVSPEAIVRYNSANQDHITKKDLIKSLFTIVLYGGTTRTFEKTFAIAESEYELPAFFGAFQREIEQVGVELIHSNNPHIFQLAKDFKAERGKKAKNNALLSLILQDLEAQIVCCALEEFAQISRAEIVAYAYDGFMAIKDPEIDKVCAELSQRVRERTGYAVVFLDKPFESPLQPPDLKQPTILASDNMYSIDHFKDAELTKIDPLVFSTCAYISNGAQSQWVFRKIKNGEPTYEIVKSKNLRAALVDFTKKITVEVEDRPRGRPRNDAIIQMKTVEETWELSTYLRSIRDLITFERIDFVPYLRDVDRPNGVFNLFSGYAHEFCESFRVNEGMIAPIINHINDVWCSGDQVAADYILNWLARLIQTPWAKLGTAILLKSTSQGAGKNILCDFIGKKVIGPRYATTLSNSDQIFSRFNSVLEHKLLVVLDEISDNGLFHKLSDRLKILITQSEMHIERKGLEIQTVNDFTNYIFLTNNNMPIKVEATDRRYFTLEVSNAHANDPKYFGPFAAALTDEAGKHFFHFLAQRNTGGFVPSIMPATGLKRELKMGSAPTPLLFMKEYIEDVITQNNDHMQISARELFSRFIDWTNENKINHRVNAISFGREMAKIIEPIRYYVAGLQIRGYDITYLDAKNKCDRLLGL